MADENEVPALLRPTEIAQGRFRFDARGDAETLQGRSVVFGGEILAKAIIVSARLHPGMPARSVHAVFARAARHDLPAEFVVEPIHAGRSLASDSIALLQEGRVAAKVVVMADAGDPDLVRHDAAMPRQPDPDACAARPIGPVFPGTEQRPVGGVDFRAARSAAADPVVHLWMRAAIRGAPIAVHQAVIAWNSVGMLIGTAMLPHTAISQAEAHRTLSTGVLSHSVSFHAPVDAGDWLLFSEESASAGGGRCHGRGLVFARDGRVVASFTQDALLRRMPERSAAADPRHAM